MSQVCLVGVCTFNIIAKGIHKYFPDEVLIKSTKTMVLFVGHRGFLTLNMESDSLG